MLSRLLILLLICSSAQAALITAAGVDYTSVNAAYAASSAGDVILIPKGTNNWGSSAITLARKVYVTGMGVGRTKIVNTVGNYRMLFQAFGTGTNIYGYSNFTMEGGGIGDPATLGVGHLTTYPATLSNFNYRVHHIAYTNQDGRGLMVTGKSQGVVDHCTFHAATDIQQQGYTTYGLVQTIAANTANVPVFGTYTDYAYVEDCVWNWAFDGDGALDYYANAKAVIRFNDFTNCNYMAVHNFPNSRGATQWEFYGNRCYGFPGSSLVAISHIRSGTGLACSNSFTSDAGLSIGSVGPRITEYRSSGTNVFEFYYPYTFVTTAPSPASSGTSMVVENGGRMSRPTPYSAVAWPAYEVMYGNANAEVLTVTARSGNTLTITRGTPARAIVVGDQLEAVISDSISGTNRIDGNLNTIPDEFGYPGSDQVGWTDPQTITSTNITQTLNPAYFWENTHNGTNVPVEIQLFGTGSTIRDNNVGLTNSIAGTGVWIPSTIDILQENRDFYNTNKPGWTPPPYPHYLVTAATITPASTTTTTGGSIAFSGTTFDGSSNVLSTTKFYVMAENPSGGSVVQSTGVYTAGTTNATDIVLLIDNLGNQAEAPVVVSGGTSVGGFPGRLRRFF